MKKIVILLLSALTLFAQKPTLEEMYSQMIIIGFAGDKKDDKWVGQIGKEIRANRVGGVTLIQKNIHSPAKLKELTAFLQSQNQNNFPLFIAIEQEGGFVQTLNKSKGFEEYASAQVVAENFSLAKAQEIYEKLSIELKNYGFNLNFAPVVDLKPQESDSQNQRSYSSKEEIVQAYSGIFLDAMKKEELISVLKYFPGNSGETKQTFKGFADVSSTWDFKELKPYYDFIKYEKADMVMVGHIYNSLFDKTYPASLSYATIQKVLREKLGFEGVVIVDDMQTDSLLKNYDLEEAIVKSINAGVDVLLFSNYFYNDSNIVKFFHETLQKAIANGKISAKRVEESYERIIKLKQSMREK